MGRKVYVVGVGMTKFEKPGSRDWTYVDMVREAGTAALEDAGVPYSDMQQVAVGYSHGDSTAGQRAVYELGLTGVPVYNVNNNCATGSTALFMAKQFVEGGLSEVAMAVGFEKMEKGPISRSAGTKPSPMEAHGKKMFELRGYNQDAPVTAQFFGNAGKEHMELYGTTAEHFAWIGWKNHKHSVNNPNAQFQNEYTLEEILESRMIHDPLTKLQCSPTSDGAAAAIVCSEAYVKEHGLEDQAIEIAAMTMVTDLESTFSSNSSIKLVGADMAAEGARQIYAQSGMSINDVDVIELHDCFSANELLTYEALGMAEEGKAGQLIDEAATTYGGRWVVNPSGGLISKGHPLGATGVAQCAELSWHLRGTAGARQVAGAEVGLQHNIGLGGAAVLALYKRAEF